MALLLIRCQGRFGFYAWMRRFIPLIVPVLKSARVNSA